MYVTKILQFAAGHRLFKYDGNCNNIHGHNYTVEVTVSDDVNDMGFVIDFKDLSQRLKIALSRYDHALLLHKDDPLVSILNIPGLSLKLHIMDGNPTAENIAKELYHCLPQDCEINVVKVKLYETDTSFAEIDHAL